MKLLLTGFTPFNNESINPSFEVIKLLDDKINDIEIIKKEIDTSFNKSFKELKEYIDLYNPDYVLLIGQAGNRLNVSIEKIGINYIDSKIPDNDGEIIKDTKISVDGPDAYFVTLDILKIKEYVESYNLKLDISYSAGTFVCNYLLYKALEYTLNKNIKVGFIHVPYIREQLKGRSLPYMELIDIKEVLYRIIESLNK